MIGRVGQSGTNLTENCCKVHGVLPPGDISCKICLSRHHHCLLLYSVPPVRLLVVTTEEAAVGSSVDIRPLVQQPLDNAGVLRRAGHVKGILSVVLLGQVDVVQEEREDLEQLLRAKQVHGGPHQETHVERGLANTAAVLHLQGEII